MPLHRGSMDYRDQIIVGIYVGERPCHSLTERLCITPNEDELTVKQLSVEELTRLPDL